MENPTRRLDSEFDNPPDESDSATRSCLRCGTDMLKCQLRRGVGWLIYRKVGESRMAQIMNGKPDVYASAPCFPFVCPQCGYTELVTEDPIQLLEAPSTILSRLEDLLPDPDPDP